MKNIQYNEQNVKEQYKDAEKLNSRMRLHSYNVNKTDWNNWCFSQMEFPDKARVLELGCGDGFFWDKNKENINNNWRVVLSDFSKGMLENAKKTLEQSDRKFTYEQIDAQDIPYEDESFDVVIARHMLYHVTDIEKTLSEIKRVLTQEGTLYATTNSSESMAELHELMNNFDSSLGLNNCGMGDRFNMEGGQLLLKKHFREAKVEIFQGKIVVSDAEPVVSYAASTIRGNSILVGEKRKEFEKYVEGIIREKGNISITTKSCIFKVKK